MRTTLGGLWIEFFLTFCPPGLFCLKIGIYPTQLIWERQSLVLVERPQFYPLNKFSKLFLTACVPMCLYFSVEILNDVLGRQCNPTQNWVCGHRSQKCLKFNVITSILVHFGLAEYNPFSYYGACRNPEES